MKTDHTLTVDRLRSLVNYDADSGKFTRPDGSPVSESLAGHYGRLQIYIDGRMFYASRVAFACHHGQWPDGQVDHINGDYTDNRATNLRDVTNAQNAQNRRRAKRNNSTGFLGVSIDSRQKNRPYRARIMIDDRMVSLGYYPTAEEAHDAYIAAKRDMHPHWVEHAA